MEAPADHKTSDESATGPRITTMRAIVQDKYGSPDILELKDVAKPTPAEGEVLIQVHSAGVNPADWHMMTGTPSLVRIGGGGFLKPKVNIPGIDIAGRIVAVGDGVTEFEVGDDVFGEAGRGYAEYTVTPIRRLVLKPTNVTFVEAAAVPIAALTALQGLRDKGQLKVGEHVLINGASGGVGTFAVQIAKAFGAEVTAVCSTRNVEMVRSIGADHVIDYTKDDFTTGAKYDLVLDNVGLRSLADCKRALKPSGRYVAVSGPKTSLKMLTRMVKMMLRSIGREQKMMTMLAKSTPEDLIVLKEYLESGRVTAVIEKTYPLSQVADAMRRQGEGHAQGKTVITLINDPKET